MSLLFAMFSFSLAMSISPGPVNMIILSSSANYGIRRTFAFVSGATIGFSLLLLFIGLGFDKVINTYPFFLKYLAVVGSLFIVYMGFKIASSTSELSIEKQKQVTFLQGFILQWLNPKAWLACVAGVSMFTDKNNNQVFIVFTLIYFFVCYLSLFSWSILGSKASLLLDNNNKMRIFNRSMGGLLMISACFLLYSQIF